MILKRVIGVSAATFVLAAAPGQAASVLDDYGTYGDLFAPGIQATNLAPVATGTTTNGTILGGARDISTGILVAKLDTWDNDFAASTVKNGWWGALNTSTLNFSIDQAAEANFSVAYDGAGVGAAAAGLNINVAALGSKITLTYLSNQFINTTSPVINSNGYSSTDIWMTLTDTAGQTASVTARMDPQVYGSFLDLDFAFSDFEAANANLDLTSIFRIEYGGTIRHERFSTGWLDFSGAGFGGSAYTPVNAPGGVPEPASWAMMIGGLGLAGAAMRRRVALASA